MYQCMFGRMRVCNVVGYACVYACIAFTKCIACGYVMCARAWYVYMYVCMRVSLDAFVDVRA